MINCDGESTRGVNCECCCDVVMVEIELKEDAMMCVCVVM